MSNSCIRCKVPGCLNHDLYVLSASQVHSKVPVYTCIMKRCIKAPIMNEMSWNWSAFSFLYMLFTWLESNHSSLHVLYNSILRVNLLHYICHAIFFWVPQRWNFFTLDVSLLVTQSFQIFFTNHCIIFVPFESNLWPCQPQ